LKPLLDCDYREFDDPPIIKARTTSRTPLSGEGAMRRINLGKLPRKGFFSVEARKDKTDTLVRWTSALLMAHVETPQGPDLQILREEVGEEAVFRIESGDCVASNHAQAMVIVDESEIILSMRSRSSNNNADASVMIGFENTKPLMVSSEGVGEEKTLAVILRNFEEGILHILDNDRPTAQLQPGLWTIQSASVPDGQERTSALQLEPIKNGHRWN
jgi:hypothetical protein